MELSAFLIKGRRVMPLYFFHLSFGDRTVPDEDGVELPNRSAAREEALAVIRDLADPDVAVDPRRWASWFLQVADEAGQFLRMPIGRPALEVVTADAAEPRAEEPGSPMQPAATAAAQPSAASRGRSAMLVQELSAVRKRTEQLLQHNQWLRDELSSLCLASEGIRARTSRLAPGLPARPQTTVKLTAPQPSQPGALRRIWSCYRAGDRVLFDGRGGAPMELFLI
jgi:hypothetical protein